MPKDYRIGPCRIYTASSLADPLSDWTYVGPTRGNVVATPTASSVARGRADQTGQAPLATAIWSSPREIDVTAPMADRDIDRMETLFPGAVKTASGSKKSLAFQPTTAGVTPQAYAVVPVEEWADGSPWWDSPHTIWLDKAYLMVTGEVPVNTEVADNDDAIADTVYEVEFRRALGSSSGIGEIWLNDVSILGLDIAYQPEFDQVDPILSESAGTFSRGSTATYLDDDGTYHSVGTDVPRYVSGKRLLMEPQRTNIHPHSEAVDDSYWLKNQITVTADDATAPDGASTADKVETDANTGLHRFRNTETLSDGETGVLSTFCSPVSGDWIKLILRVSDGNTPERPEAYFDVANGNVGTTSGTSNSTIVDAGFTRDKKSNGFYRPYLVVRPDAGWKINAQQFWLAEADGDDQIDGSAKSAAKHFWGMQFESGSFPTSYIPTSGSAVTRSGDSLNPLSDYTKSYDASAGLTLYIKAKFAWSNGDGPSPGTSIFRVQDDDVSDYLAAQLSGNKIAAISKVAGTVDTDVLATGHARDDTVELAIREQSTGYTTQYALNGGSVTDESVPGLTGNHADGLSWKRGRIDGFGGEVISAHVARGDHTLEEMRTLAR